MGEMFSKNMTGSLNPTLLLVLSLSAAASSVEAPHRRLIPGGGFRDAFDAVEFGSAAPAVEHLASGDSEEFNKLAEKMPSAPKPKSMFQKLLSWIRPKSVVGFGCGAVVGTAAGALGFALGGAFVAPLAIGGY